MTLRIALIADSHLHPEPHNPEACYAADGLHNDRTRAVLRLLAEAQPDVIVHLGDITHPVPGRPTHEATVALAAQLYGALDLPWIMVPGNHDVGDKPQGWATAPRATPERHALFRSTWNEPWGTWSRGDVCLLWFDTPILGTDTAMERAQQAFVEQALAEATAAGQAIYALCHYPPFLHHPDEPEHYDNLAPTVRGPLLHLLTQHGVRALFSGHVHHPFLNRHQGMDCLIVPATSFVRPGYAQLGPVPPLADNGREAPHKLGFLLAHVDGPRYALEPVRLDPLPAHVGQRPPTPSPLGITWRHDWTAPHVLPASGLDEFRRKTARNDLPLWAMIELGLQRVRLPAADLLDPDRQARLLDLHALGLRYVLWTAGSLATEQASALAPLLAAHPGLVLAWEITTLTGELPAGVAQLPVPVLSSVLDADQRHGDRFSHFPHHGWTASGAASLTALPDGADGLVGLVRHDTPLAPALAALADHAQRLGGTWTVLVELPRAGEGERHTDDDATAARVQAAADAAEAHPELLLVLDTFVDLDRGYYARNGLVDGRGALRPAGLVLRERAAR